MTLNQMLHAYKQLTTDYQARRMDKASHSVMFLTTLTSTLFGYFLLHKPAVKNF